jgi:hypothetical protein
MSYSQCQFPNHFGGDITEQFEPTFVKLDKQVLRFYSYFKEHVVESRLENERVRRAIVYYYLEDKSIMVTEPKQVNSGVPQGLFLKRQVVVKPNGSPFMPQDFGIGIDVGIFGRQLRMYDCDEYTRHFFKSELKIDLPPACQAPQDNFAVSQIKVVPKKDGDLKEFLEKALGGGKVASQKQFLDNDRNVLRFFCSCEGLQYTVHYYLADDTFEIRECHHPNDGRDAFALLLRRQKLPDRFDVNQPGQNFIGDNYLTADEITPTSNIHAYGKVYVIQGVDEFTQKWYMTRYGYDFPLGNIQTPTPPEQVSIQKPPYNGFGDEVDTLGQMYRLVPQKPKVDFFKAVDNDKNVLRFTARFNTTVPEDVDRRFIVAFFLSDDSVSIYEPAQKNSGIIPGKFLHRRKYKNVDNNNETITPSDLAIGGDVKINGHSFHILSCDDYTGNWMKTALI